MRRRWWWPKNKLHIIRWFYDEYKIPVNSLIWKEKSSFIITLQLKICELFWFDENKFSAIFWTEQNFLLVMVTWNLMFDNKNICFSSSWQTAVVGIREWCKKNTSCSWNLSWKCTAAKSGALVPAGWASLKREIGTKVGTNLLLFRRWGDGRELCVQETFWISDLQNQVGVSYRFSRTERFQRLQMCKKFWPSHDSNLF